MVDLREDLLPRSSQTPLPIPVAVPGTCGAIQLAEMGKVCFLLSRGYSMWAKGERIKLTTSR
jgi:hypothetical protein